MAEVLRIMGAVAGIGGLALAVFLLLVRGVIKKISPLPKKDSAKVVTRLLLLTATVCVVGVVAYVVIEVFGPSAIPTADLPAPNVEVVAATPAGYSLQISFATVAVPDSARIMLEVSTDVDFAPASQLLLEELFNWQDGSSLQVGLGQVPVGTAAGYVRLRGQDAAGDPISPGPARPLTFPAPWTEPME